VNKTGIAQTSNCMTALAFPISGLRLGLKGALAKTLSQKYWP
jgi:hypothetical protein